jgi:hypothetical protein
MPSYYGAFLLDPDGNSAEAVVHDDTRRGGYVDHLWIGVRDLDKAAAFHTALARHTGLRLAFPASDERTVQDFHEAAIAAGYRGNGTPGERAHYPRIHPRPRRHQRRVGPSHASLEGATYSLK